jgi:hypothetical protein
VLWWCALWDQPRRNRSTRRGEAALRTLPSPSGIRAFDTVDYRTRAARRPSSCTFATVLGAWARLAGLEQGRRMHGVMELMETSAVLIFPTTCSLACASIFPSLCDCVHGISSSSSAFEIPILPPIESLVQLQGRGRSCYVLARVATPWPSPAIHRATRHLRRPKLLLANVSEGGWYKYRIFLGDYS